MRSKKGQAAAEYLVTYGWALLLLVVVIAILLSTGIFNPSAFVGEECVMQPDIPCTAFQLYRSGSSTVLLMSVQNRLGYAMLLDEVKVTTTDLGRAGEYTWTTGSVGTELGQGENATVMFTFTGDRQPAPDDIERMHVALTYYSCAREVNSECGTSGNPHTVSGRVSARVLTTD
ncbi:MAG: hypothetical protein PHQ80_01095 [Candidatus ainarchaeum sp.]|nr:hypothetical protein [Candidatus ainarchaeum sp.]MDD5095973.1 hypothetical protein [Candidatus ainarchaeum sp.]